jgi:hypothetical protein
MPSSEFAIDLDRVVALLDSAFEMSYGEKCAVFVLSCVLALKEIRGSISEFTC